MIDFLADSWQSHYPIWRCNYVEGCNKACYYHVCRDTKHTYICPEHLEVYLGFNKD